MLILYTAYPRPDNGGLPLPEGGVWMPDVFDGQGTQFDQLDSWIEDARYEAFQKQTTAHVYTDRKYTWGSNSLMHVPDLVIECIKVRGSAFKVQVTKELLDFTEATGASLDEAGALIASIEELAALVKAAEEILDSDAEWETKYELIFSRNIRGRQKTLAPKFNWYDPDMDYEDDVRAYVSQSRDHVNSLIDLVKAVG